MIKKHLRNIFSLIIGLLTYLQIFGSNFLFSKTSFFFTVDHPTFLAGYLAYINDSWNVPLTVTNNLFYENNISIIFMDSIPLFSFLLKTIYSFLGYKIFNPFPIWYLVCYLLFAFYAGKILSLQIKNDFIFGVSLLLLVNTPLMVNRMLWHSALSAHWIVLSSIYYYLINKKNNFNFLNIFALMTGISIFIHIYIFSMIASVYIVTLLLALTMSKLKEVFHSLIVLSLALIVFFFFFFSTGDGVIHLTRDYFKYGAEFNSFFCGEFPVKVLNEILWCYPPYTAIGHEGYGYLGLGFIFLLSLLIFFPKKIYYSLKSNYLISLCLFFMAVYSFGNKWKIAHKQFYEFQPLLLHMKLLEIFRATGRFIWPVCYFLMVYLIFRVASLRKKYLPFFILTIALILQLYDTNKIYEVKSSLFKVNIPTTQQAEMAKNIFLQSPEEVLYLLPDERCSWGEIDHYIVALYYLNEGGTLQSTRTARLKINPSICNGYNVEKDIKNNIPFHFLINDIGLIQDITIINNYTCIPIISFEVSTRKPSYCKKQFNEQEG